MNRPIRTGTAASLHFEREQRMKYTLKARDTFEYHCLEHFLHCGDISQEEYDQRMLELLIKYTKLAKLLAGK